MASTLTRPLQPPLQPRPGQSIWRRLYLSTWRGRFAWFFAVALMVLLLVWIMARMTPSWYQPLSATDQAVIDAAGRADNLILFDLRNKVQDVPVGTQRWSITQDEINAFLAIRTATPLRPDGTRVPPASGDRIADPYVIIEPGYVSIAARLRDLPGSDPRGGVGTLTFSVGVVRDVDGSRKGLIKLAGARVGYLPVPTSLVESKMRTMLPGVMAAVEKLIDQQLAGHDIGSSWTSSVEDALTRISREETFPLEYRIDKKQIVIDDIAASDGKFTLGLSPPPRNPVATGP